MAVAPKDRFSDSEYNKALDEAKEHLKVYGNWAVSPCMFKYGIDTVSADLSAEMDTDVKVRETAIPAYPGAATSHARPKDIKVWIATGDVPGFPEKM